MKGKSWAPWLLAGMLAFGSIPAAASNTSVTATVPTAASGQSAPSTGAAFVLTRETAKKEVRGTQTVRLASRSAQDAYEAWQDSVIRANNLDTEKRLFKNPWNGATITIRFNDKTQLRLRMQKYLMPDQMKFSWQMASKSLDLTVNSLENSMDSILFGLYAAQNDLNAKGRLQKLSSEALSRAKASKAAGNVTQLTVDAAALDLEKAGKALTASERSFENQCRNYNRLVGAPLSRRLIVSLDVNSSILYLTAEDYASQALQNRMTLFSLREGIKLKEKNLEMLTFKDLNKIDADIASEYEGVRLDLESTRLDLDENMRSVTAEILSAFIDLESAQMDLKIGQQSLRRQKAKLETMKKQIDAGRIPAWSDDALVNAIAGMEEGLAVSRLSLAGKVRRFQFAVQVGPAYSGF
jgi:hypothetical protein